MTETFDYIVVGGGSSGCVVAALICNDANVPNTARALGVPTGDLRELVLVDQRLADAALEAVEFAARRLLGQFARRVALRRSAEA
jgi:hypothetical protein